MVLVFGTATAVGKTWVGAEVLRALRSDGVAVAARKPVQSFAPGDGPTDAEVLAAASGEQPGQVCPPHRWYEIAMAPPMAAEALRRPPFTVAELVAELAWPADVEVGVVESAGGVRSPLAADGDSVDLVAAVAPDLVALVAPAGLGAINAVRLAVAALAGPVTVVLNGYDGRCELHRRNRQWLAERDGLDVASAADELVARVRTGEPVSWRRPRGRGSGP